MSIRAKIFLIVLPLIVMLLIFTAIFAVIPDGTAETRTRPFDLAEGKRGRINELAAEDMKGWQELSVGGAGRVVTAMTEILYKDETGRLGHTFNLLIQEL